MTRSGFPYALGAQRRDILALVLREGFRLIAVGLLLGAGLATILARALRTFLFEVQPTDPVTLLSVVMLFAAVALPACYLPARRATKVDPMEALRHGFRHCPTRFRLGCNVFINDLRFAFRQLLRNPGSAPWPYSRSRLVSGRTRPASVSSIICIRRRLCQGRMFEDQHFRFFGEAVERKVLFVRGQVSHVGLPFCPVVDSSKLLRPVWIPFEVPVPVVHGDQDRWGKPVTDGRDLVGLEDVKL